MRDVGRHREGLRRVHEILSYLFCPGLLFGGLVGIVLVLLVHWQWPDLSPAVGALILVACCAGGSVLENVGGALGKR